MFGDPLKIRISMEESTMIIGGQRCDQGIHRRKSYPFPPQVIGQIRSLMPVMILHREPMNSLEVLLDHLLFPLIPGSLDQFY